MITLWPYGPNITQKLKPLIVKEAPDRNEHSCFNKKKNASNDYQNYVLP